MYKYNMPYTDCYSPLYNVNKYCNTSLYTGLSIRELFIARDSDTIKFVNVRLFIFSLIIKFVICCTT